MKTPSDFWHERVEPAYNDQFLLPEADFPHYINSKIDLDFCGEKRTVKELNNCLEKFWKAFNLLLYNYRRSGQNDASFKQFLRVNGSDFNSKKKKMLFTADFCFVFGTEHENVRFLSLMTRTADGEGFAGRESGLGVYDWKV